MNYNQYFSPRFIILAKLNSNFEMILLKLEVIFIFEINAKK